MCATLTFRLAFYSMSLILLSLQVIQTPSIATRVFNLVFKTLAACDDIPARELSFAFDCGWRFVEAWKEYLEPIGYKLLRNRDRYRLRAVISYGKRVRFWCIRVFSCLTPTNP
mgnify:CR=1 FL=1